TYAGVIRYTSVEDTGRILSVNLIVAAILIVIVNINLQIGQDQHIFPLTVVFVYFLCVNFLLILYRLAIRKVFGYLFSVRRKSIKAILYNAGYEGLLAKKMISDNRRSEIKIASFIEDNEKLIGKNIEATPVVRANRANLERLKK